MHIALIIYLVLVGINLLVAARFHGTSHKLNFWGVSIDTAVSISLLAWAGVFSY